MREVTIFSGTAHVELALEVCECLGVPLSPSTIRHFGNDCLYVQLNANCRESDVFLIEPLGPPVQEHLAELLFMLDAARGAPIGHLGRGGLRCDGDLDDSQDHAECCEEALGALPVLFMAIHAMFQIGNAATVSVAHEAAQLRLQHIQVA